MEGSAKKLYFAVLVIQSIYAGMFLLSKVAFDVGMNTSVFVFYRQAAATVFLAPIALLVERSASGKLNTGLTVVFAGVLSYTDQSSSFFFIDFRKTAPRLTFTTFFMIFMLSLCGITMSLNIYGVALKYTSATLAAATTNSLPVVTFLLALLFRMEKVELRSVGGIVKVLGIALCMGGVATIAFYRGPTLKLLLHHHLISHHDQQLQVNPSSGKAWVKGVFLMLLSNTCWSLWLVVQGQVLKVYPSKLLCTTLQCFTSTIQSFVVAIALVRDPSEWQLGWNVKLLSVAYCGIVVTGVTFYLQAWVVEKKGPLFLAMTTPLSLIITIATSAFLLGEIISLGSILGGLLLVGGLYSVLWGKNKEHKMEADIILGNDIEKAGATTKAVETTAFKNPPA